MSTVLPAAPALAATAAVSAVARLVRAVEVSAPPLTADEGNPFTRAANLAVVGAGEGEAEAPGAGRASQPATVVIMELRGKQPSIHMSDTVES
jgi:hypothetical protein